MVRVSNYFQLDSSCSHLHTSHQNRGHSTAAQDAHVSQKVVLLQQKPAKPPQIKLSRPFSPKKWWKFPENKKNIFAYSEVLCEYAVSEAANWAVWGFVLLPLTDWTNTWCGLRVRIQHAPPGLKNEAKSFGFISRRGSCAGVWSGRWGGKAKTWVPAAFRRLLTQGCCSNSQWHAVRQTGGLTNRRCMTPLMGSF